MDFRPKILDRYIIKKFLGTFFFTLCMIMVIVVVFDYSEKVDNFLENNTPVKALIFDYYLNFIPYFATLFAPLFVFVSVIFFTSKLAAHTEIIAILSSGVSFKRLLYPYIMASFFIFLLIFCLMNFIIPKANNDRMLFEDRYYKPRLVTSTYFNLHRQVYPNIYLYMETYSPRTMRGENITLEHFDSNGRLESKISAPSVVWDTTASRWTILNYTRKEFYGDNEIITSGARIDTVLNLHPDDMSRGIEFVSTMPFRELNRYIELLELQGSDELKNFQVEKHNRFATPFSVFILTIIGVSLSSMKVRGGIGMNIGLGMGLSFSYILFQQFASQFAIGGNLNPTIAMWIPNVIYAFIAFLLYRWAPK